VRQATSQAATCASLAERASQGQRQAEQLDEEARVATSETDQLYEQLRSEWGTFLGDPTTYHAEKQRIETLRFDAGRLTELDQARGRLQGAEEELALWYSPGYKIIVLSTTYVNRLTFQYPEKRVQRCARLLRSHSTSPM